MIQFVSSGFLKKILEVDLDGCRSGRSLSSSQTASTIDPGVADGSYLVGLDPCRRRLLLVYCRVTGTFEHPFKFGAFR